MNSNEICHVGQTNFHGELGSTEFSLESGRYWLFTSKLCPFAHRTEIVRALKGLDQDIGLTVAGPVQTEAGWDLRESQDDVSMANPVAGIDRLPAIYQLASPGYDGRVSVPVLFDLKTKKIVNNESSEIVRQIDRCFPGKQPLLYPEDRAAEIDSITDFLEKSLITPIYQAGFAQNQATYRSSFRSVFTALDRIETMLGKDAQFLAGDELTLADVHAFAHLSRFDAAYHSLYRLNLRYLRAYPSISLYLNKLAEIPAFSDTLDVEAFKHGYFLSWNQPTEGTFVPIGPAVDPRSGLSISAH